MQQGEKIYDSYYWSRVLQEDGDGGKVVVCRKKATDESSGAEYVMKIRSKTSLREHDVEAEFVHSQTRLLNFPPHHGVMPLYEVLEDDNFYYVIMEKGSGGQLFASLAEEYRDGCMPERAVRRVMREILEAVSHIHGHGMLHRDIKPDNLVVTEVPDNVGRIVRRVTLIDFDHADADWIPGSANKAVAYSFGTKRFRAPEVFQGYCSERTDLYSVGIILYLLMTGSFPYPDEVYSPRGVQMTVESCQHTVRRMMDTAVDFESDPWPEQPLCMDLCRQLLAVDAERRVASAEKALQHPWFHHRGA